MCPRASRWRTRLIPRNPEPPVTRKSIPNSTSSPDQFRSAPCSTDRQPSPHPAEVAGEKQSLPSYVRRHLAGPGALLGGRRVVVGGLHYQPLRLLKGTQKLIHLYPRQPWGQLTRIKWVRWRSHRAPGQMRYPALKTTIGRQADGVEVALGFSRLVLSCKPSTSSSPRDNRSPRTDLAFERWNFKRIRRSRLSRRSPGSFVPYG